MGRRRLSPRARHQHPSAFVVPTAYAVECLRQNGGPEANQSPGSIPGLDLQRLVGSLLRLLQLHRFGRSYQPCSVFPLRTRKRHGNRITIGADMGFRLPVPAHPGNSSVAGPPGVRADGGALGDVNDGIELRGKTCVFGRSRFNSCVPCARLSRQYHARVSSVRRHPGVVQYCT